MPQVRALTSFKGRLGNIRQGMQFHCDPGYIRELNRKIKQVEIVSAEDVTSEQPGPGSNKAVPRAPGPLPPSEKKKVPAGSTLPAQTESSTADLQGAGSGLLASSSPPDLRSALTTASVSVAGAKHHPRSRKKTAKQPAK